MKRKLCLLMAACFMLAFSMTACGNNDGTNNSATEGQSDINGDGVDDVSGTDLNGDGVADGFGYDVNGDGIADGVVGDYNDPNAITNAGDVNSTVGNTGNANNAGGTSGNTNNAGDKTGNAVSNGANDVITGVDNAVDKTTKDLTGNANNNGSKK